ncbi:LCP family protein [Streptomyces yaizuensis]|uniref:LCP family protein n=1 Tax=Streptomyces yaizuensis TaxID=2989713 RepID=A0ABQ5NTQ0_9ACTN|nr:LytR C-terminal domain-containing protein [Streptomyces sp. YSPA8]GLF93747.1 LCP family protein [Streptomyces sp. YSPA8]
MNDQQNPYDPYYPQPRLLGYDAYGQPVYEQPPQYDPYAGQSHLGDPPQLYQGQSPQQQPYVPQQYEGQRYQGEQQYPGPYQDQGPAGYDGGGHDPYAPSAPQAAPYDPYAGQPREAGGGDAHGAGTVPAPADTSQSWQVPQQPTPDRPAPERPETDREYRTEQFSFIEEPDDASEDVIDWLKFTESRSERREEARRRGRNRVIALVVVLVVLLAGGAGYLWFTDGLPGGSSGEKGGTASGGPQKRDVIVVHLHNTKKKGTSTALLVDNSTTRQGTTVLLPNSLAVAHDDGTGTTLGKSVDEDGSEGTREAVGALLGARITGTWRLDTPFLENLVELVGSVDVTTDAAVPAPKGGDPLVKKGENQTLNGRAAVAYATHRGPGETEAAQLQRFGQVMRAVLRKLPSDARSATVTVETLGQILDPSLTESALGASLATLSEYAKGGDYRTELLPVREDGTLSEQAADDVVKNILGGSVTTSDKGDAVRVAIRNATGRASVSENARVLLVNGGYAVVDSGRADPATTSSVTYGDEARKAEAEEVAKTLGLPGTAVKKAAPAPNAEIGVVLGQDFPTG